MNIIKTIKRAVKATVGFVKDIIAMLKSSFEVKKAKLKAWHEYKKMTDSEYFEALVTIVIALIKILLPIQAVRAIAGSFFNDWN